MLAVSSRHSLYVERSGNKGGHPIFFLHGGPGSHVGAAHRRYFDPDFFDIVLFDQRGCGQSAPAGETQENDTWMLVEDINTIRNALGINGKISLFGGSWGSTLALAYALRYPQCVEELILRGIFLGTDDEIAWYTHGLSRFAPEAWQRFARGMGDDLLGNYYQAVQDTNERRASEAARHWVDYEMQLMRIGSGSHNEQHSLASPQVSTLPSLPLLNRARVQLHFLQHQCFLADDPLLDAAHNIRMPVTIVQGGLDLVCPPITAWRLSQRLPQAKLHLVPDAGHGAMSDRLAPVLKAEVDGLRDRLLRSQLGKRE
ncbi:MAG: alpha/beta fold hydrolase [Pseudomonadales bacterium]|nr:alpha/beta fold hydrolase [Pseudomonadales bacterium]